MLRRRLRGLAGGLSSYQHWSKPIIRTNGKGQPWRNIPHPCSFQQPSHSPLARGGKARMITVGLLRRKPPGGSPSGVHCSIPSPWLKGTHEGGKKGSQSAEALSVNPNSPGALAQSQQKQAAHSSSAFILAVSAARGVLGKAVH